MQEKVSAGPPPSLVWLGASHKIGMYPAELGCALREGKNCVGEEPPAGRWRAAEENGGRGGEAAICSVSFGLW